MWHMECRVSLWNLQTHIPFFPNWHVKNPSSWEAFCEPRRNPGHLDIIAISCHHHQNVLSAPHYNIPPLYLSHKDCCHCLSSSGWDEREERQTSDRQDGFLKLWLLVYQPNTFECEIIHIRFYVHHTLLLINLILSPEELRSLFVWKRIDFFFLIWHLEPDTFPPHL